MKKKLRRLISALLALMIVTLLFPAALAEGPEPHGDGNGILSRPLLASLYRWLSQMDSSFWKQLSFDDVSNAVGKWGCVKEKDRDLL